MQHHILLIDDDPTIRESMKLFLEDEGFLVKSFESGEEGIAFVRQKTMPISIALVDFHLPDIQGPEIIKSLTELNPEISILGFSGDDSVEAHNTSLDSGASFFINKDTSNLKLLGILKRTCRKIEKRIKPLTLSSPSENKKLIESVGMIGVSVSLAEVASYIKKFGPTSDPVCIQGANGTGKEKVARAIHEHSNRKLLPFLAINCASIPVTLIESELFGHEKGSFTGATSNKLGIFQAADGGSVFLDEIGELPLAMQASLLRVLQEKTIKPIGSNKEKHVDFRLITATNANLEDMVLKGTFRQDLYYRIHVLPIKLEPLNNRREDIPYLAKYFLDKINFEKKQNKEILESTALLLQKMDWKGNIRELEHCITFLECMSSGKFLDESLLKERKPVSFEVKNTTDYIAFQSTKDSQEKNLIITALEKAGSISGAAKFLDMSRSTLRDKIKKFKIEIIKTTQTGENQ
ncbi:MAG: sigma-54-dependent Fis family transcriptional regulator [Bdellovibrionales bacterium]|nr:sigma-54-dependent Fis family transcriptional regulator [Bdellovibrionales bacterium]